jgi:translation elongation factor EF-Tu-like GTPase
MKKYLGFAALLLLGLPAAAQEPAEPQTYAPEELVPAEFSLSERTREGGRSTPFFTSYRPRISVDSEDRGVCRFVVETEGGHRPGTTGEIGMTCPFALSVGQEFQAYERTRPIGSGIVLPRPATD